MSKPATYPVDTHDALYILRSWSNQLCLLKSQHMNIPDMGRSIARCTWQSGQATFSPGCAATKCKLAEAIQPGQAILSRWRSSAVILVGDDMPSLYRQQRDDKASPCSDSCCYVLRTGDCRSDQAGRAGGLRLYGDYVVGPLASEFTLSDSISPTT
jgi:hypothetical protein